MVGNEVTTANGISRKTVLLIAAFAAVYIFWGSTYLAIKYAIETLPPFLMAGARFAFAGSILYIWARLSPDFEKPKFEHWRTSFIVGTLLLLGGNGGVVLAQHYISSSLAALLVATEPFWIVLLSWLWLKGTRPNWKVALGLAIGFLGVCLLIAGNGTETSAVSGGGRWIGILAVICGAIFWATGSMYGLRAPVPKSSILTSGMQMLCGSFALLVVGFVTGEWSRFDPAGVSANSLFGLGYLIIFGSLIGFTAYSWLLKNAQPEMVSTYAYINPVVAVILGWFIAGESMTGQMLVGAAVIIGSVFLITSQKAVKENETAVNELHESCGPNSPAPTYST